MALLTALSSAIIWGLGQTINKQPLKGLFFFIIQLILIGIELATGTLAVILGWSEAHFRNCGFFIRGIWGLVTLGEIPRTSSAVRVFDHSVMLLISGLMAVVFLVIFAVFFIWNIVDAYKTRKRLKQGIRQSSAAYFKHIFEYSFEYIAIAPGIALVLIFSIIPILFSALIMFTNYNMNNIPPRHLVQWTGFQTLRDIFRLPVWSTTFFGVAIWTVIWAFAATFSSYLVGFAQAIILQSKRVKFAKAWRGLYILPWAIPAMISMLVFRNLFLQRGAVNRMLIDIGLVDSAIPFLGNAGWARAVLIIVNVWLGFPYAMALISGILSSVNQEMYEAADIDGANSWQKMTKLTVPTVLSSVAPLLILSVTFNFNNFGIVFFVTEGGPLNPRYLVAGSTDILISWIYKLTLEQRMFNYAGAMSVLIFVVVASVAAWNLSRTRAFKED